MLDTATTSVTWVQRRIEASIAVKQALAQQSALCVEVGDRLVAAYQSGGSSFWFGNGGSAADAQHLAAEFVGKFYLTGPALQAVALTVNTSALTAIGNDFGFERIFARQVEALGKPGDVAIGLSTSGNSPNVVEGLIAAKHRGMVTVGLTGQGGGAIKEVADYCLCVPSTDTPRIQESHILVGHMGRNGRAGDVSRGGALMCGPRTVFLDRDGVINRHCPGDYVKRWEEFEFLPRAKEALALLSGAGLRLIVVTNQRGVARGVMTAKTLGEIHRRMCAELAVAGASIAGIYACTHDEGDCTCRKPQTGLFDQAKASFADLNFNEAALIGDSLSDLEAGLRVGCRSFLVADEARSAILIGEATRRGIPVHGTAESLFEIVQQGIFVEAVPSPR